MKWLRRGDPKYRGFFIRRVKQLAAGERTRILAKRLVGCKSCIFETYLEQKSGRRILWTSTGDQSLLIWYVAKHKDVSQLAGLIDDAERRSRRQLTPASTLPDIVSECQESESDSEESILLDPLGDTPLKIYEVRPDELHKLKDTIWKPPLFLTSREREIVETRGTVLLLGRSGTGKTLCICNRMDCDRQQYALSNTSFSQLFIARSQRLCHYVREAVGSGGNEITANELHKVHFSVFNQVLQSLEARLPQREGSKDSFLPSRRMDFFRFKRDVYKPESTSDMDALVVWTSIRSFIKGSIEALLRPERKLSEEEYLGLGKRRCRLLPEQRKSVYKTYERYSTYMTDLELWDDCDRITALADRLEQARVLDPDTYAKVCYNKIYVDEAQDYTQAEIAVFFYLCGSGDLFLAGDPAQSVVEGVEFRFEEVRSVGFHLYGGKRRNLIPNKPLTVTLNFRSHAGILKVAAAVLSCLFRVFPDSAKQLKEDRGLFRGPRPGVFHKVPVMQLLALVAKLDGVVLLTHDRNVPKWKHALGNYPLVYGIREAKGLEFQSVILVDFFGDTPPVLQKPWRNLLLERDTTDASLQYPELEGQLKLLYTAVTRCIQRLFFAETRSSVSGDAFVRWLTARKQMQAPVVGVKGGEVSLAVKNNVGDVERMVRTPDEWRSAGLDNAVMAEASEDLESAKSWLERSIYCFQQVRDDALASRARAHISGLQFRLEHAACSAIPNNGGVDDGDDKHQPANSEEIEVEAALLTGKLLVEGLISEAREVCLASLPVLSPSSQDLLRERIISRLSPMETESEEP